MVLQGEGRRLTAPVTRAPKHPLPSTAKETPMNRDQALAILHREAADFTYWATQDGPDYAITRLRAALNGYDNAIRENDR